MSVTVIYSSTQKAAKEYHDDGSEYISEWIQGGCCVGTFKHPEKITFAEGRILVGYRKDYKSLWRIKKGELYQRQFNSQEGQVYTFRMKKDIFDMAVKYDLFSDC